MTTGAMEAFGAVGARVVFDRIEKQYGPVYAVNDVSLAVGRERHLERHEPRAELPLSVHGDDRDVEAHAARRGRPAAPLDPT